MLKLAVVRGFAVIIMVSMAAGATSCGEEAEDPYGTFGAFFDSADDIEETEAYRNRVNASLTTCMEKLGYPAAEAAENPSAEAGSPSLMQILFGVLYLNDESIESGLGYGFVEFQIASDDWFEAASDPLGGWKPESYAQAQQHNADWQSCQQAQPDFVEMVELSMEVLDAAADLPRRVFEDSRLAATNAAWSACMRRSGHSFSSPLDAFKEVERLDEEVGMLDYGDFDHGHSGITPDEYFDTDEPVQTRRDAMLQLQLVEVELAHTDLNCRKEVDAEYAETAAVIEREEAAKYRSQMERMHEIVGLG